MQKLKVVELYAGAGRSSAPFKDWEKADLALLVDWNEHARRTYLHNYPDAPYVLADLASMTISNLKTLAGDRIDIVLGCPPCQGFSESGKRDLSDPRNDHILHFIKLAIGVDPSIIAMENVPMAALSKQFQEATRLLDEAGYAWTAAVLNAASYGSTQARYRLVLLATKKSIGVEPALPSATHMPNGRYFDYMAQKMKQFDEGDNNILGLTSSAARATQQLRTNYFTVLHKSSTPNISEILNGLPRVGTRAAAQIDHVPWAHGSQILRVMKKVSEGGQRSTRKTYYASAYARLHRKGLARTITTYFPNAGSGRFWHPTQNRAITLREAARIQGFPDSFRFIGGPTKANAILVGNALDAALANATYMSISRILK